MIMQRMEKLINYIYFCLDEFGSRRPLIAGSNLGSNLDSVIHPSSEFKKLILEQIPTKQDSIDLFVWIDGTEFRIGAIGRKVKDVDTIY